MPADETLLIKSVMVRALSQDGNSVDTLPVHLTVLAKRVRESSGRYRTNEGGNHLGRDNLYRQQNYKTKDGTLITLIVSKHNFSLKYQGLDGVGCTILEHAPKQCVQKTKLMCNKVLIV